MSIFIGQESRKLQGNVRFTIEACSKKYIGELMRVDKVYRGIIVRIRWFIMICIKQVFNMPLLLLLLLLSYYY